MYYRAQPLECIDANINGLRNLLDYAVAERDAGRPLAGFLFYSSSEIYGDPAPDAIPTPETYRGNVSCTGPRACYDETKRFGETLCVELRAARGVPVHDGAAVQQLRPGAQDHRRARDARLRARHARRPRHRDALGRHRRSGRSATRRTRSPATTRCSCAGAPARPTTSASTAPRSRWRELAELVVETARELFGYKGKVVLGQGRGGRLPGRQPEPPLPGHRQGARASWATTRRCWSRTASAARSSGTTTIRTAEPPDEGLDHRHGLRRPRDRRVPRGEGARRRFASTSTGARSTRSTRGARRSTRRACTSCWQRTSASGSARRRISRGAVRATRRDVHRGRHAGGRRPHRSPVRREGGRRRSARRCAAKPAYHAVVVKSTVIPGTTDGVVRRAPRAGSGKRAGADFGVGMNPEFLTEGQAVADFMNPDRIVLGGIDARTHDAPARRSTRASPACRASSPIRARPR